MKKVILSLAAAASVVIIFQLHTLISCTNNEKIEIASSKNNALKILREISPLREGAYSDAALTEGDSGYAWDDGSYYCFTINLISENGEKNLGDMGSLRLVKKNTREVYLLDLEKDIFGNILKRI